MAILNDTIYKQAPKHSIYFLIVVGTICCSCIFCWLQTHCQWTAAGPPAFRSYWVYCKYAPPPPTHTQSKGTPWPCLPVIGASVGNDPSLPGSMLTATRTRPVR